MTKTRKQQLEEMLADDPNDSFLRYGLAMEHVSAGEDTPAAEQLCALAAADPSYIPAFMQGGQALLRLNRVAECAALWLRGIEQAQRQGNAHAAEEMTGMVEGLE